LRYGLRGPSELGLSDKISAAKLGQDHFGMIARTRLPLAKGVWELSTLSDDGVRVSLDDKSVIENWTWHGPTRDTARLELAADKTVDIVVEHFQIDGYAHRRTAAAIRRISCARCRPMWPPAPYGQILKVAAAKSLK
jgi:hypothetical protein